MSAIRLGIGLPLAALVTFALFMLMHSLIFMADTPLDESGATKLADIFMPETDIDVNVKEAKPDKPEDPEEPPPDLPQPDFQDFDVQATAMNMSTPVNADINVDMNGASASDGEYLPIVKVAPIYPNRAATRGIEGYCIVSYTVTTTGATREPQITDCPNSVFASASKKAALKFKYKPRIVDGVPVEVPGVRNKFTYNLDK